MDGVAVRGGSGMRKNMAEEKWSSHVGHFEEGGLHGWCASCPPRNDTGRSSGQSRRRDTPLPSVGSTSSRTLPIGRTTGTSIEWHAKTRSGPVDGRANPETTRTDGASWGPTIVSEASSVRSRAGGNACDPTLRGTLEGDNRLDHIRARSWPLPASEGALGNPALRKGSVTAPGWRGGPARCAIQDKLEGLHPYRVQQPRKLSRGMGAGGIHRKPRHRLGDISQGLVKVGCSATSGSPMSGRWPVRPRGARHRRWTRERFESPTPKGRAHQRVGNFLRGVGSGNPPGRLSR